jgi:hypothetical protein
MGSVGSLCPEGHTADLRGAVYGQDVEGTDTWDLIGCVTVGAGVGASAGTGASCTMMDPLPSAVN